MDADGSIETGARPDWRDPGIGTMKRVALWLLAEVGEGHAFTKTELRNAFPGTSQVDRRMRDLRDYGWVIHTNREDASLDPSEQRFVGQGAPVWIDGKAVKPVKETAVSATLRREVMYRDGNFCRSCGITPGESYDGSPGGETAQLDIARRKVVKASGETLTELVTECKRCRVGSRSLTADAGRVERGIARLSAMEKQILANWMREDRREFSALEQLWAQYRSMPEKTRSELREALGAEVPS